MKSWFPVVSLVFALSLAASLGMLARGERVKARQFVRERELPAFGEAIVARLSLEVANYRRAGDAMLADGIVRDWILAGERDVPRLLGFMNRTRSAFDRELVDMSIVSDPTETFYCTDGRVLRLSPQMKERDGWYYSYRASSPGGNLDSWYNDETGVIGLYVNVPIRGTDGEFLGVAGGSIDADQFMETVRAFERGHSVRAYLFRGDGEIVYATDRSLVRSRSLSADSVWNEPIMPALMRSRGSPSGVVLEPNGPKGPLVWGGIIPEWDTFVVIERDPEEIRSLARREFAKALAFEGAGFALMIALLLVSMAFVARRSAREGRDRLASEARLRAIADGHARLVALAEGWLSGMGESLLARNGADLGGKDAIANARYLVDSRAALFSLTSDAVGKPGRTRGADDGPGVSLAEIVARVRGSYAAEISRRELNLVVKEIDRGLVTRANGALALLGLGELVGEVVARTSGPADLFVSISGTSECPCVDFAVPRADGAAREREGLLAGILFGTIGARLRYLDVNETVGVYHIEFCGSAE